MKRLFTDRVLMEVPIITMGPNGGPVIDVDSMLLNPDPRFNIGPAQFNPSLTQRGIFSIRTAKAFENNVEIAFEVPSAQDGGLKDPAFLDQQHSGQHGLPASSGRQPCGFLYDVVFGPCKVRRP